MADSSLNTEDRGYFYDAAWNLNRRTNNGVVGTFSVDVKNQLTSDPTAQDGYDSNGNLTGRSGGYSYSYDDANRLASLSFQTSYRTDFVYDGLGRLRKRIEYSWTGSSWFANSTTCYIYDGNRVIQERDGNTVPQVSYTRGTDLSGTLEGAGGIGGLLARSHGYSSGNWTTHNFYHADGNGNVTYLVDSTQALAASYRYDPFGNLISKSGTFADANVYRFSSKECHANSGLYYFLSRLYSPNLQRWLNRDPIGETSDLNLYRHTGNSPVHSIDPDGRYVITDTCDATQKRQIEASIKASCEKAKQCAKQCPSGTPSLAVSQICDNPKAGMPVINCTKTKDGKPCTSCGYAPIGSEVINLCPKTFDPDEQNKFSCKRDCVIFHEANHAKKDVGLSHGPDMSNFDTCMGCPR